MNQQIKSAASYAAHVDAWNQQQQGSDAQVAAWSQQKCHGQANLSGGTGGIVSYANQPAPIYNPNSDSWIYAAPGGAAGTAYVSSGFVLNTTAKSDNKVLNKTQENNMFLEVLQDVKKFIKDHKTTVYWVALFLIADHFLFEGAFKLRIKNIMGSLVGKIEAKVNDSAKV